MCLHTIKPSANFTKPHSIIIQNIVLFTVIIAKTQNPTGLYALTLNNAQQ
jgi:hypothetical protein